MEFMNVEFLKIEDRGAGPAAIFRGLRDGREFALRQPWLKVRIENLKGYGADVSEEERALAAMAGAN